MPIGILVMLSDSYFECLFSNFDYVIANGEVQIKVLSCGGDFEFGYFNSNKTEDF